MHLTPNIRNGQLSVNLTPETAKSLIEAIRASRADGQLDPARAPLRSRLAANVRSEAGLFSGGARRMLAGLDESNLLAQRLSGLNVVADTDKIAYELNLVKEFFKGKICKGVFFVIRAENDGFDTHAPQSAKQQPAMFKSVVDSLTKAFNYLERTPFDEKAGRSLLDVTTFIVTTEFSRTMRQNGKPISDTGTDHNPLSNSVIIGGKGIKGGHVIGASDLRDVDPNGNLEQVSPVHRQFDNSLLQVMGKPFDFTNYRPLDVYPETYEANHYLSFASIANTLYELFKTDRAYHRVTARNQPPAKPLDLLLR